MSVKEIKNNPSLEAKGLELDREDRDKARLCLDRNIVVEAGAGTGKTSLLTDRALFLILGAGVPITEIVALTFTEKAASEIQVRLGDRLAQIIGFLDGRAPSVREKELYRRAQVLVEEIGKNFNVDGPVVRQRAGKALEDMDKAMIGTLHSFAAWLLRAYPLQAGVDPGFQVDEGDRFEELFPLEWSRWLEVELAEHSARERQWMEVLGSVSIKDLEVLARDLCKSWVSMEGLSAAPPGMTAWLQETIAILKEEPVRQPKTRGGIADQIEEICRRLEAMLSEDSSREKPAGKIRRQRLPSASWPKGWDAKHYDRYKAALKVAENSSPHHEHLIRTSAGLLRSFVARFKRAYSWRGFISFDGLLIAARDLVRDHADVRAELKKKIRAFLVDEFQDTDPLQGELLIYLSEREGRHAEAWEKVELMPGKLLVVGDPKQSIYRFRGADLAAYERFTRHMLDSDPPALFCELKTNFRSHSGILDPVNEAFHQLIRYSKHSQPEYKPVHPYLENVQENGNAGKAVEVIIVEGSSENKKIGVSDLRRTEAEYIASWLEEHCASLGGKGTYKLKDVAILLRTTTPLEDYLDVFRTRQIPYVMEAEKYFYGTQEVLDFLNLLRSLDDPSDRRSLAGLLRSPLVGISDRVLYQLAEAGELDYRADTTVKTQEAERINLFYSNLRFLQEGVGREPLGDLIRGILDRMQVLQLLPAAYHGQQTLSNLMKFVRMAAAADGGGMTLREFIHKLSRSIEQSLDEGESPLADEHLDAVRIMTIHKAKGLEFPVVFLPNVSGKMKKDQKRGSVQHDWDSGAVGLRLERVSSLAAAYLEIREKKREADESARLLYVAWTRAKQRLLLTGAPASDSSAFSAMLNAAGVWPDGGAKVGRRQVVAGAPVPSSQAGHRAGPSGKTGVSGAELERIWEKRRKKYEEWAGLGVFISPSAQGAPDLAKNFIPDESAAAGFGGSQLGRLCHKLLEHWDWKSPGDLREELEKARQRLLWEQTSADWAPILLESEKILKKFFKSEAARKLSQAEIIGREIPFAYRKDRQVVRGSIDILYRWKDQWFVADYKTDAVAEKDISKKAGQYRKQGELYAEAVRRSLGVKQVEFELIFLRAGISVAA